MAQHCVIVTHLVTRKYIVEGVDLEEAVDAVVEKIDLTGNSHSSGLDLICIDQYVGQNIYINPIEEFNEIEFRQVYKNGKKLNMIKE